MHQNKAIKNTEHHARLRRADLVSRVLVTHKILRSKGAQCKTEESPLVNV